MRRILTVLFFLTLANYAWSQKADCAQVLNQAQEEFNAGHFFGLSSILQECLESKGFTNEQEVQAYMLLTQAYLLTDDPMAAEDSYLRLLKADPEYVADEIKDPVDVYYLSKKFTATPKFTPTLVRAGVNVSMARIIQRIDPYSSGAKYKEKIQVGFLVGSGIDWNINDNIAIGGELNFSQRSFKNTTSGIFGSDTRIVTERQYWIDVPVYAKYAYHLGRIRPFGYAGAALNFLIGSNAKLEATNFTTGSQSPTQGPDVSLLYKRNFFNYSIIVGGGVRYKIGKDFIVADLRYMAGMSNVTNAKYNYYDARSDYNMFGPASKYQFIGDYFRLDNLSLSFGYVKPLYDPRKIKKARTRSAMKKISKQDSANEK